MIKLTTTVLSKNKDQLIPKNLNIEESKLGLKCSDGISFDKDFEIISVRKNKVLLQIRHQNQ